ncbi:MAG TPA: M20/M25/M40 family metallo-hydrolase [Vicinamibacterales bacterium]|nr:M20/M25/M40 family metallo-hydrolase [Vicinamibacterales bacterium]
MRRPIRTSILIAVAGVAALAAAPGARQALSANERAISGYIDAHNADALALLERVVNINSGTQNFEGVRQVGAIFRSELDALGFKTEWVDGAAWNRAGHLVATHPGPSQKMLLIGHLDTVFDKASPFQRMERIDGDHARGPGIIDMKGGDVVIVQALKALKSAGALDGLNITVVMTGDEEAAGRPLAVARKALIDAAKGAAVAIGFEDGDGDPAHAVVARRGSTSWRLEVTGVTGHSSQVFGPDLGAGAIYEAARILNTFRDKLAGEAHLTFSPGVIVGGTAVDFDPAESRGSAAGKTNVVAGKTIVAGDVRALSVPQFDRAKQAMTAIVKDSLPRTSATIMFDDGYPPLAPAPGNERLLVMYDRASRDLGLGIVTAVSPDKAGAADVSFVASEVPMIIDAVGLKGSDDHSPAETADLRTLPVQTKRAAILIMRLGQNR